MLGPMGPKWAQKGLKIAWDPFGTIWDYLEPILTNLGSFWARARAQYLNSFAENSRGGGGKTFFKTPLFVLPQIIWLR